jgi:hypothetical protein
MRQNGNTDNADWTDLHRFFLYLIGKIRVNQSNLRYLCSHYVYLEKQNKQIILHLKRYYSIFYLSEKD